MSSWQYDSGGHKKDQKKYAENYTKIFGTWPCEECGNKQTQGHKLSCSKNWRNSK
jgi:hypothetical protein